jgi:arginyl-tRNA synthetase
MNEIKARSLPSFLENKKFILDFSGPNIGKNMHFGHLRSILIGNFISNLLKYYGSKIIKISHLGDWGNQFGCLMLFINETVIEKKLIEYKLNLNMLSDYYKLGNSIFESSYILKKKQSIETFKLQSKKKKINNFLEKNTFNIC